LLFEVQANDSLAELVTLQSAELLAQKEFLQTMEISQTDLDSRLLTQRKSGTLIAILIPSILFLLILLVLIWLIIFRHRMLSMFNHLNDRWNELSKRLDDQENAYKQELNAIRAELQTSGKEVKTIIQKLATETDEKFQNLEKLVKEEQVSHEVKHAETHKEYEVLKGSLQKSYDSLTSDLSGLKEELSSTAKELTSKLKELIKQKPD
ncbi:MAG: hypothetical protein IH596_01390, partial [Bacteroidales bacterium]|nr:hypothetical protein [Bacteroidales bacterium]